MTRSLSRYAALLLCSIARTAPAAAPVQATGLSAQELSVHMEQVATQLRSQEENLRFVETQYTERPEPTDEDGKLRRFSDGEIQYLLGDYASASVLFYDLVSDPVFKAKSPRYAEALYYLSDSLYQQQNFIGARLYLRELLNRPPSPRYKEILARYLEVSGRLNHFEGIDGLIEQARTLAGGKLPPELAFVYGKWLFKRNDLPSAERLSRARAVFLPLSQDTRNPWSGSSLYYVGVLDVQAAHYPAALASFRKLSEAPTPDARSLKLKELSFLSMGRVLYEMGRYDEALDRYAQIPRESDSFVESLYEIAWAHVRKGEFEKARNATDILLMLAPDSTQTPDAKLLQGHLLLKLKRYAQASKTYMGVINDYAPVRDEVQALLTVNKDPVTYFDNLLARNQRTLDVATLLPPLALKYATTQVEVSEAIRMMGDLESGRQGVGDAGAIAQRILQALEARGLEAFPEIQEGYTRADAVDSALTRSGQRLNELERTLLANDLSKSEQEQLQSLRKERDEMAARFKNLPTSIKEVDARRERMRHRLDALDKEAFKLGYTLQSMFALAAAVEKWVNDTHGEEGRSAEEERDFLSQVQDQKDLLTQAQEALARVREQVADQRSTPNASVAGEEVIRTRYAELLQREHALLAPTEQRLGGERRRVLDRAHALREKIGVLHVRAQAAKDLLRAQVQRRGRLIQDKVLAEQGLLSGYQGEVGNVTQDARQLVGRIAFDSFQRVRQQFYDLVLKADVGLVDVAFTRKQDKTAEIQKRATQHERNLRLFDQEFQQVLKDVD